MKKKLIIYASNVAYLTAIVFGAFFSARLGLYVGCDVIGPHLFNAFELIFDISIVTLGAVFLGCLAISFVLFSFGTRK